MAVYDCATVAPRRGWCNIDIGSTIWEYIPIFFIMDQIIFGSLCIQDRKEQFNLCLWQIFIIYIRSCMCALNTTVKPTNSNIVPVRVRLCDVLNYVRDYMTIWKSQCRQTIWFGWLWLLFVWSSWASRALNNIFSGVHIRIYLHSLRFWSSSIHITHHTHTSYIQLGAFLCRTFCFSRMIILTSLFDHYNNKYFMVILQSKYT